MQLTPNSEKKLKGVHPDLVKVVRRAAQLITQDDLGFIITCGPRTIAEQRVLFAKKATKTMKSRHIPGQDGTAKAIDFAVWIGNPKNVKWDWPLYVNMSKVFKQAAKDVRVPIEWGGDWKTFRDGPHVQLPHTLYP